MGEQVRWGLIGPGSIATNIALGLAAAPSARLVAVAGRTPDRAAAFAERHGATATDVAGLLADPAVDAVHIAVPHPGHAPLALQAIRAGKAVVVEKPMGLDAAEVTALVEAAEQQGVILIEALDVALPPPGRAGGGDRPVGRDRRGPPHPRRLRLCRGARSGLAALRP